VANWLSRFVRSVTGQGTPANPSSWLTDVFGGRRSHTGVRVNESQALGWVPMFSGIRFLSETLGAMPMEVYRRREPRGREPVFDHPIMSMVRNGANSELAWDRFIGLLQCHAALWGNGYAEIVRSSAQEPIELWPLTPDRVTLRRNADQQLQYVITLPRDNLTYGETPQVVLPARNVLHLRGFSSTGVLGDRLIALCREAIGLGIATEQYGAQFFGEGMSASGILTHPAELGKEAQDRLRAAFTEQVGGLDRAHRLLILEEGMQWVQTTIEPEKGQFLGTRKFQVIEACRMLRLPPHILYDLERATFSNIEQQNIELAVYSLTPWCVRWEKEIAMKLISDKMRNSIYPKFNMTALLRGDTQSRFQSYALGRQNGWLSVNDIRELEDMNPVPGGDTYLEPVNMRPLGSAPETPPANGNGNGTNGNIREDLLRLIREASHGQETAA
jgi:HK97 family phage portal protein